MVAVLVMMNNYFHDVASAMLIIATLFMLFMTKEIENNPSRDVKLYFSNTYKKMSHVIAGHLHIRILSGQMQSAQNRFLQLLSSISSYYFLLFMA